MTSKLHIKSIFRGKVGAGNVKGGIFNLKTDQKLFFFPRPSPIFPKILREMSCMYHFDYITLSTLFTWLILNNFAIKTTTQQDTSQSRVSKMKQKKAHCKRTAQGFVWSTMKLWGRLEKRENYLLLEKTVWCMLNFGQQFIVSDVYHLIG